MGMQWFKEMGMQWFKEMGMQWFKEWRERSHQKKETGEAWIRARNKHASVRPIVSAVEHMKNGLTAEENDTCLAIERCRPKLSKRAGAMREVDYHPRPWADLLFHIVSAARPFAALEMGTYDGISGSYLASAMRLNDKGHLWTIDGSQEVAEIASQTFSILGLTNRVTQIVGPFSQTLEPALAHGPFNFALINGHHDKAATVKYFNQLKPHMAPSCVTVFDDILRSPDMRRAWKTISSDPEVGAVAQIGRFGITIL